MVGSPDDNPFMLRRRIGHLDDVSLNLEEPGAQGGQIAVGIPDLMQKPSGGDTQRFSDFRHDLPFRFPVLIPEHPGLITGETKGINILAEIPEGIEIIHAANLAQQGFIGTGLPLFPGKLHGLGKFVMADDMVGVEIRNLFPIAITGISRKIEGIW